MSDDKISVKGLDQLTKALKAKPPTARIGILGSKAGSPHYKEAKSTSKWQTGGTLPTNAEIGAAHEYGTTKLPMRSFLRVPIADRLQKEMEARGAFDKKALEKVVAQGSLLEWVKKVAVLAEGIVIGAFDSGGYGKWQAWKTPGYTNNANQILVDTTQLRNSITSEVKDAK